MTRKLFDITHAEDSKIESFKERTLEDFIEDVADFNPGMTIMQDDKTFKNGIEKLERCIIRYMCSKDVNLINDSLKNIENISQTKPYFKIKLNERNMAEVYIGSRQYSDQLSYVTQIDPSQLNKYALKFIPGHYKIN
jgi:hypothetical protein